MTDDSNIITMPTPENVLVDQIRAAYSRAARGLHDFVEGSLDLIALFKEARLRYPNNHQFSVWLAEHELDFFNGHDRAALINMGDNMKLARIILQETTRTSYQYIWLEEMQPRLAYVSKMPPTSASPDQPAETAPPVPVSDDPPKSDVPESNPLPPIKHPPLPTFPTVKPKIMRLGYDKVDLVLSYITDRKMRHWLGNFFPEKKTSKSRYSQLWDLLVYSMESGAFGLLPPSKADWSASGASARLILPWISFSKATSIRLDLLDLNDIEIARNHLIRVVLANKELLIADPDQLLSLYNRDRVERENKARTTLTAQRRTAVIAKLPVNERSIVVYGQELWPVVEGAASYSFDDLCLACWFCQFIFNTLRETDPASQAISVSAMMKFTPEQSRGWVEAVRAYGNAYKTNPTGESNIPPPPPNFRIR